MRCLTLFICAGLLLACSDASIRVRPSGHGHSIPERALREPNSHQANTVAFRALSLVGTPYVYGGETPEAGFDCSGFMKYLYRDALGKGIQRTVAAQSEVGQYVNRAANLRLGDLVFFVDDVRIFHVGLYVGEGRFVHAPRTGKSVELSSLALGYWAQRFSHGRRLL